MSSRITRREFLTRSSLAGAGALLASRAQSGLARPLSKILSQEITKTELKVPLWWAPYDVEAVQALFDNYFTPESGINVTFEGIYADYFPTVFARLASDEPYDLLTFNADSAPQFISQGALRPLNDLIERDQVDMSDFDEKAIEQWTHDGNLYGLSNDMGSFHCYFNKDLFEQAGLRAPEPTEEWTWDQLLEWSRALTVKEGEQIVQYGFAANGVDWARESWPNLNGAHIWDEGLTKSLLGEPAVIEAFQFYQNLMYEEGVALRPGTIDTAPNELFVVGQLAIMLDGTWQVGFFRDRADDISFTWDVGLPPRNASATQYFIPNFTAGWVIPINAQDVNASWEALQFYASPTFNEVMLNFAVIPVRHSATEAAYFDQWPERPPQGLTADFYAKVKELGASRRHLKFDLGDQINALLSQLDLIPSNEAKPDELCPTLAEQIDQELAGRPWNQ